MSSSPLSESTEKKLRLCIWGVTALVFVLVGLMRRPELRITLPEGMSLSFLPMIHAVINSLVACCLIAAIVLIKKGNIAGHRKMMTCAVLLSVTFLLCYLAYHFTNDETRFGGTGMVKMVYLVLLLTHILFATLSFPLILFTYLSGWADRRATHRALAKWTFPMWLYVAVTGPICYLMLRPYY